MSGLDDLDAEGSVDSEMEASDLEAEAEERAFAVSLRPITVVLRHNFLAINNRSQVAVHELLRLMRDFEDDETTAKQDKASLKQIKAIRSKLVTDIATEIGVEAREVKRAYAREVLEDVFGLLN
ncbi:hypothetical protein BDV95DRAFT_611743 [Massariosphaeria phaeospora]|uniref:Uncharacterized protein n=1 Tax=Massariosphaeria phaeospora TaxID=100035 RepID=A0A7C8M2Q6_9PLEO|nr:hypothetical protein BDV95DRAFT_611743 [Massariosphaeria phaeospora]